MIAQDESERLQEMVERQMADLASLVVAVHNPKKAGDLYAHYERRLRLLRNEPQPEGAPGAPVLDRDDPRQVAFDIAMDPWIGGIVRQVNERARAAQLEQEAQMGLKTRADFQAHLAKMAVEREAALRQVRAQRGEESPPTRPIRRVR